MHTGDLFNFRLNFHQGMLSILPPQLLRTPYADGNDVAGIRLPDVSVPSATYTGWALRASDPRNPVAVLFAKTNAQHRDRRPAAVNPGAVS
jgi:hypothetical protein